MELHDHIQEIVFNWNETGVPIAPATKQERRIEYLLINGITTNAEIAHYLCITPETAAGHIDNLRAKYQAHSRAQLVAYLFHSLIVRVYVQVSQEEVSHAV